MAKRLCPIHGIYEKITARAKCPKCSSRTQKRYNETSRNKDLRKFYDSPQWRKVRVIQLTKSPLCVDCGRVATVADHIIEIKDGGCKLCLDNLQSLCNGCHTSKSAKERKKRKEIEDKKED